jgi:hypothetical protein
LVLNIIAFPQITMNPYNGDAVTLFALAFTTSSVLEAKRILVTEGGHIVPGPQKYTGSFVPKSK